MNSTGELYKTLKQYQNLEKLPQDELKKSINKIYGQIYNKIIENVYSDKDKFCTAPINPAHLFIDFSRVEFQKEYSNYHIHYETFEKKSIDLKTENIITFPERKEAIDAKMNSDTEYFPEWESHNLVLIKPFNIYVAINKHHSITANIQAEKGGKTYCTSAVDYTQFIKDFDFDGEYFCNNNGNRICLPFLKEFGDLFLLGKVIVKRGIGLIV